MLGIGLCLLDKYFFGEISDGAVASSQRKVDDVLPNKSIVLPSTHHDVTTNQQAFQVVLDSIYHTMQETEEKNKVYEKTI